MTASAQLWRPGIDAPLFPAELLNGPAGVDDLDPELREQVCAYLAAVVADRGPVHVNVAWNALHYGWDLAAHGYAETLLNIDRLPTITRDQLEMTPTGVIGTLASATPVWVEVVHVEADDLTGDVDGDVSAARSGAPYDSSIRMRAVLDERIFGSPDPDQRRVVDRLVRRGHLDRFGHMVSSTAPADIELAEEAAGDPMSAYARWLTAEPARLGGGPVPAALYTDDAESIRRAVVASLYALLVLADADPRLTVIGEQLAPIKTNATLAAEDLEDIVRQVQRVRGRQQRYTSTGPALRHLGADRPIHERRYVSAFAELTKALITTACTQEGAPVGLRLRLDDPGRGGGVWRAVGAGCDPSDGYDPLVPLGLGYAASLAPTELSVIAAADPVDETPIPESETAEDGSAGHPAAHDQPNRDDGVAAPTPEEPPGERGDGLLGDLDVTASHLTFTFALRTRHLTDGTLPVPTELHDTQLKAAAGPLAVRLGHDGDDLADEEVFHEPVALHAQPCQLRGLTWPLRFYPGLLLTATWTVGGRILDVTTEQLPDPVIYAGIELTHATDLAILAAHIGEAAPDSATEQVAAGDHARPGLEDGALDGDPPDAPGNGDADEPAEECCGSGGPAEELGYGERDLADTRNQAYLALLLRTVVRTLEPDADGVRSFTAPVLVATAFAGLLIPRDAVGRAERMLDAYAARGRLLRLPGKRRFGLGSSEFREEPPTYLWWPPASRPPVHRAKAQFGPAVHRPHNVPITLRELPDGWEPSPEKIAAWPQVYASLGPTLLPKRLPPGHTWVEAHERGKDPGWRSGAVRRG